MLALTKKTRAKPAMMSAKAAEKKSANVNFNICRICPYETAVTRHFIRHLGTKKHKLGLENSSFSEVAQVAYAK